MAPTAITNVRIFDGESVIEHSNTVVIEGQKILSVGNEVPEGATVIDAHGATLLPGLIDSHTHSLLTDNLRVALNFGVTTELEMMGHWSQDQRKEITESDDMADLRTAGLGMSPKGGHPSELFKRPGGRAGPGGPPGGGPPGGGPPGGGPPGSGPPGHGNVGPRHAHSPEEAVEFVEARVKEGSDYIKIMIEEGSVLKHPGLPMLSNETVLTAVKQAHSHNKMAIAHVLTVDATKEAIAAGMDGLAHVFIDRPHDTEIIDIIAASGAFVTPCLVLNSSIIGHAPTTFASDARVESKLNDPWKKTLCSCFNTFSQGSFSSVLATVKALHDAGVDVLCGTDASVPDPDLGGVAHGASVHHELQMLVAAGLTPVEALRAATALPAKRFGLNDRGRIVPGARADLLLVDGNPTKNISDTLSIRDVWRRGVKLNV